MFEVHAENACEQRQREEDRRYDREKTEASIRPVICQSFLLPMHLCQLLVIQPHPARELLSVIDRHVNV